MVDDLHADEGPPCPVAVAHRQEKVKGLPQDLLGAVEPTLGAQKRGFEVEEEGALDRLARSPPQVGRCFLERLFSPREVRAQSVGIANVCPGTCSEILDRRGSIGGWIEMMRKLDREVGQALGEIWVLDCESPALFEQPGIESPGMEARAVADEQASSL